MPEADLVSVLEFVVAGDAVRRTRLSAIRVCLDHDASDARAETVGYPLPQLLGT